ncbi:hypothetical protein [Streptomyces sp. CBMA29]|uniref:hypothetical protein n=1 Tax=Streptomyces sp. CBMA29 TaxID=1896314 RepID=UPI001661CC76|nr:hypothetical protein [Streptomyces sp. CBMA29]MBD0738663.1 hypothetical protein [Streptomyces sp. CBMA29]
MGDRAPVALMYRSVHHEADVSAVPEAIRPMVAARRAKEPSHRPSTDQLLDRFGDSATAEAGMGDAPHRTGYAAPRTPDPRTPVPAPTRSAANSYAPRAVPPPPSYAPGVPWPMIRFAECVMEDHESAFRMAVVLTDGTTIRTGRASSRSLAELTEWAMRFTLVRDRRLRQ